MGWDGCGKYYTMLRGGWNGQAKQDRLLMLCWEMDLGKVEFHESCTPSTPLHPGAFSGVW